MIRGTTPTHNFTIPFDVSFIADLRISYAQTKEVLTKTKEDCTLNDKTITVKLSQEDTFKFDCSKNVKVQVRILTIEKEVVSSEPYIIKVGECLNNEVL